MIPFFKKIGFVGSDGAPSELYRRFRNPSVGGTAIADAIKIGYAPLKEVNEYFYEMPDQDLSNLILQVTGLDHDNQVAKLVFSTLKGLKNFADFKGEPPTIEDAVKEVSSQLPAMPPQQQTSRVGLNLSYTINLNLPATADQTVFNAIFKSLKEHLITNE